MDLWNGSSTLQSITESIMVRISKSIRGEGYPSLLLSFTDHCKKKKAEMLIIAHVSFSVWCLILTDNFCTHWCTNSDAATNNNLGSKIFNVYYILSFHIMFSQQGGTNTALTRIMEEFLSYGTDYLVIIIYFYSRFSRFSSNELILQYRPVSHQKK